MKAFKGFNKDLTCRGFQYEEGKEFHTEKAECCELAGAKMVQVDGEKIKADTYYRCVDGEVVEADE